MHAKFYFTESALANGFAQQVVAHVLWSQIRGTAILKPAAYLWIAWLGLIRALICGFLFRLLLLLLLLRSRGLVTCLFLVT